MTDVVADIDFYATSNGGITLSGGEPLGDIDFAMALLKSCKDKGINRCVETSGYLSSDKLMQILPWVDILLFDYKITQSDRHRELTGVTNELILANLDLAYQCGTSIVLRCPIIPGINDTEEHFKGIASLDKTYPNLQGIELMPYHSMGNSKRTGIGRLPTLPNQETTPPELPAKWIQQLRQLKCEKVTIG